jgi:hypothetical protein
MKQSRMRAAGVTLVVAAVVATGSPALASGGDVVRSGSCSGSATWKLKAGHDDGRIEVQGEVDTNRNGQTWRWRIVHNGDVAARGRATTQAPSGSFEVRRLLVNAHGVDAVGLRARNAASGQVCRGNLRL